MAGLIAVADEITMRTIEMLQQQLWDAEAQIESLRMENRKLAELNGIKPKEIPNERDHQEIP